jgi:hypothetical protein
VVGARETDSGAVTIDTVNTGEGMTTGSATVTVGAVVAVAVVSGAGGGGGGAGGSMVVLSTDVIGPSANWLSVEILTCEADAANAGTVGSSNVKPINNAATREKIYFFIFIWTSFRSYILKVMLNLLGRVGVAGR